MADVTSRPREALPSINDLDLEKGRLSRDDHHRFSGRASLNISTAPLGSPNTIYSGPPPPYSYASSNPGSATNPSGYISPAESASRRSTRDEKESPTGLKSLPSISEALGDKGITFTATSTATTPGAISQPPGSAALSAITQSFPEAPKGPTNPFSQPPAPPSVTRDPGLLNHTTPLTSGTTGSEQQPRHAFAPINAVEPRPQPGQIFGVPRSPRPSAGSYSNQPSFSYGHFTNGVDSGSGRSPNPFTVPRSSFSFPNSYSSPGSATFPPSTDSFRFDRPTAQSSPFVQHDASRPYGEAVKRHLDVFDAEMALGEVVEASLRTHEFSRSWAQRSHQTHRTEYFPECLPGVQEIDEMIRQSNRILEGLSRVREVVIAQQTALTEQRARAARGDHLENYGGLHDEYKNYTGGDSKKPRRGKAAPPGRCHSCNRAETPEWRRGPDGARTLCNACGLHYAKLTRKIGVNKAAAMTGSSLRPKNLDQRMTTQL